MDYTENLITNLQKIYEFLPAARIQYIIMCIKNNEVCLKLDLGKQNLPQCIDLILENFLFDDKCDYFYKNEPNFKNLDEVFEHFLKITNYICNNIKKCMMII